MEKQIEWNRSECFNKAIEASEAGVDESGVIVEEEVGDEENRVDEKGEDTDDEHWFRPRRLESIEGRNIQRKGIS